MIEKNAVVGSGRFEKTAENTKDTKCPKCGMKCDLEGSLPRCPTHGTSPFEKDKDDFSNF